VEVFTALTLIVSGRAAKKKPLGIRGALKGGLYQEGSTLLPSQGESGGSVDRNRENQTCTVVHRRLRQAKKFFPNRGGGYRKSKALSEKICLGTTSEIAGESKIGRNVNTVFQKGTPANLACSLRRGIYLGGKRPEARKGRKGKKHS